MSDACITLAAFTGNSKPSPSTEATMHSNTDIEHIYLADLALSTAFPTQHGFVHIHTLPAPTSLVPPSDRLSTLRGLGSGGENNLGFRCMRKRMVFETVHLDVEGGVGERRTTPATTVGAAPLVEEGGHSHAPIASRTDAVAQVEVMIETSVTSGSAAPSNASTSVVDEPPKKAKKSVAFRPDRADLYDF
jgi:elongator complex protein 4